MMVDLASKPGFHLELTHARRKREEEISRESLMQMK